MAERIDKPKKFSHDWFHYIWDYYKIHIFAAAAVAVLIAITVIEVMNTVDYDVNINYVASGVLSFDVSENLEKQTAEQIDDSNGDGEKHVSVTQLNFTSEAIQDSNQIMALENKLVSLLASEDEMLFMLDETMLKKVLNMSAAEGVFVPVSEWASVEFSEDVLYDYDGDAYAINLKDSAMFRNMGVDASEIYVVVKMNYEPDDDELQKKFENCVLLANSMIKE